MSECPSHLTDPALIQQCEKWACRDRATCYHVYFYCSKHCPLTQERTTMVGTEKTLPTNVSEPMHLGEMLFHCFQQNYHADCSNAAIHTAPPRYSPLTFRIAEYLWNHFPSYQTRIDLVTVIRDKGEYAEDPGR